MHKKHTLDTHIIDSEVGESDKAVRCCITKEKEVQQQHEINSKSEDCVELIFQMKRTCLC